MIDGIACEISMKFPGGFIIWDINICWQDKIKRGNLPKHFVHVTDEETKSQKISWRFAAKAIF